MTVDVLILPIQGFLVTFYLSGLLESLYGILRRVFLGSDFSTVAIELPVSLAGADTLVSSDLRVFSDVLVLSLTSTAGWV